DMMTFGMVTPCPRVDRTIQLPKRHRMGRFGSWTGRSGTSQKRLDVRHDSLPADFPGLFRILMTFIVIGGRTAIFSHAQGIFAQIGPKLWPVLAHFSRLFRTPPLTTEPPKQSLIIG